MPKIIVGFKSHPNELERKGISLVKEEFKQIENHSNYLVSDWGRIWSVDREMFLKYDYSCRYARVRLSDRKLCLVHRLVCSAFHPKIIGKNEVDHIDRNRTNNHKNNLRWATSAEQNRNKRNTISPDLPEGVTIPRRSKKYTCTFKGKYIGIFDTPEDASIAYQKVKSELLNSSVQGYNPC